MGFSVFHKTSEFHDNELRMPYAQSLLMMLFVKIVLYVRKIWAFD